MIKKVILGDTYIKYDNQKYWVSEENVIEGTLRMVDRKLCYSERGIINLPEEIYDVSTQRYIKEMKVTFWKPYYEDENT